MYDGLFWYIRFNFNLVNNYIISKWEKIPTNVIKVYVFILENACFDIKIGLTFLSLKNIL